MPVPKQLLKLNHYAGFRTFIANYGHWDHWVTQNSINRSSNNWNQTNTYHRGFRRSRGEGGRK